MPASPDYRRSAADRILGVRSRADLQIVPVAFGGQRSFVVRDPVACETFHLSAEENALLEALRQPVSLRSLARLVEIEFAPRRATIAELQRFVARLYEQGLLVSEQPGQGAELWQRGEQRRRQSRWAAAASVLAIRVASFGAAGTIDRLYRLFGWLCSRWALAIAAALVVASVVAMLGNVPQLAVKLPQLSELARPGLWPVWIAALAGVKMLHELGHALACRHFGARPQEMGVLLLIGIPTLYCDVTDAWRLPSKWQRMAVSAAGMGVELVIAAAAALVFLYAEPGLVSLICLSLMVVCTVGTLLVNLNPLLRYDGYYLLADWLETPNLAERARGLASTAWRRWLLGDPSPEDSLVGSRKRRALWAYAILSKAYLCFVLGAALVLFLRLARPHYLQNAVYSLAVVAVAGMMAPPARAAASMARNPALRGQFKWMRLATSLLLLIAATAAVLMLPITRRVTAPAVLNPAKSHPLYAMAAGEIEYAVPAGAWVEADDIVLRLKNPDRELALAVQRGAVREQELRLKQLHTLRAAMPSAARLIPTAAAELADARAQLAELQAMARLLVVRAPAAGRVLPPPERILRRGADELHPWQGSPLEARNLGAWVEMGTPLAVIAEPGGWTAWAGVPQADVGDVEAGQRVRLSIGSHGSEVLAGRVAHVARRARANRDEQSGVSQQPAPLGDRWYHVVEVNLDAADAPLLPGAYGTVKIEAHRDTLGGVLRHEFGRVFRRAF